MESLKWLFGGGQGCIRVPRRRCPGVSPDLCGLFPPHNQV